MFGIGEDIKNSHLTLVNNHLSINNYVKNSNKKPNKRAEEVVGDKDANNTEDKSSHNSSKKDFLELIVTITVLLTVVKAKIEKIVNKVRL